MPDVSAVNDAERSAFVVEQLAIFMGRRVDADAALVEELWSAFTCADERGAPRDAHGNVVAERTPLGRDGLLERPPLNDKLARLGEPDEARWPDGRRFAAVLTHDVDRIVRRPWRARLRQARASGTGETVGSRIRLAAAGAVLALESLGPSDRAPFDRYAREEERLGFRSSFLVLPDRLVAPTTHDHWYRHSDVVRYEGRSLTLAEAAKRLAARGFDIGLHGSYASAYDVGILRHDRGRIEEMLEASVVSTRQHFLRFDADVTPAVQAGAGLEIDSTLGYSSTIGCRNGLALPFFWPGLDLVEMPLVIQDVGLLRGAGSLAERRVAAARAASVVERVAATGGAVSLSWHAHPGDGGYECYRGLLEVIERLGGWGCSLAQMNDWWRARRDRARAMPSGGAEPARA